MNALNVFSFAVCMTIIIALQSTDIFGVFFILDIQVGTQ
jgi:hypothetical protein